MNNSSFFYLLIISLFIFSHSLAQQESEKTRIGVFDSRCIAVAYGRSAKFMKEVDSIRAELIKAKEEGNNELIEKIEQIGPRRQVLLHQQGFSNGSIINILAKLKEKFPTIADDNDVQMILSKWEIMFADEAIELVDITDQLAAYFRPNEETRKILEKVKSTDPVPIEEISINPMD